MFWQVGMNIDDSIMVDGGYGPVTFDATAHYTYQGTSTPSG